MSAKHTPGPLTVSVEDQWPFRIVTKNAAGEVVFASDMPCHSTAHKNAAQALAGYGLDPSWKAAENNARAVADEVLRAAAPELLAALIDCREALRRCNAAGELAVVDAAIAKATGGAL